MMIQSALRGMFLSAFAVCLLLPSPGFLYAADTTVKGTTSNSTAASLEVTNSSDTSLLYVRNDGNVGIGTTNPQTILNIAASSGGALATRPFIQFTDTLGNADSRRWMIGTANTNYGDLSFLVSTANNTNPSVEVMTINKDGAVVINETGSSAADVRMEGDTLANLFSLDASTDSIGIGTNNAPRTLTVQTSASQAYMGFSLNGTVQSTIGSDGTGDFFIYDDQAFSYRLIAKTDGSIIINEDGVSTADVRMEGDTVSNLFFLDASADSVGIGTASPLGKLTVSGAGGLVIEQTSNGASQLFFRNHLASSPWQVYLATNDLRFYDTADRLTIKYGGNVGIGTTNPTLGPLEMGSGAYVTAGGVWTNASSRAYKEDIAELSLNAAMRTLNGLSPITYRYKKANQEKHVGFIAEDVPELVATEDRKGLSPMDIAAVLTKVVQGQQKQIEDQQKQIEELKAQIDNLKTEKR